MTLVCEHSRPTKECRHCRPAKSKQPGFPMFWATNSVVQAILLIGGVIFVGVGIGVLAQLAVVILSLFFVARWSITTATAGTVKREGIHRDDHTCDCWQCQAVGRWLKKPLPNKLTLGWEDYDGWLLTVTEGMSDTDAGLVREYTTTAMTTETFLQRWNAAPSDPAPAGSAAKGRVSRVRYNGHNTQCNCASCSAEHARRGHYWHARASVWTIPSWPAEGIGKGHRLDSDNAKCLGCGCNATDKAASLHCRNPPGSSTHMYDDGRLAKEHAAEMRQRADNYAREFQRATGQAMSADLYGALYHSKLTPDEIQRAKDAELARIRKRYTEQIVKLHAVPSMILGEGARVESRTDFKQITEALDNLHQRLSAIDGPPRNREA